MTNQLSSNSAPTLDRRTFLKRAGGTALVLVAGGGVYRAFDRGVFSTGQGAAYEPWEDWRTNKAEGSLGVVQSAILAANPHNSQPWLFRVSETQIDLFADTSRNIGTIDPFLREMYTGLGCALENMILEAEAQGYTPTITLLPDPADETFAARVVLQPGEAKTSELYNAIPNRRTDRAAYDVARTIEPRVLESITALNTNLDIRIKWLTSEAERQKFADLTVQATDAITLDAEQIHDSDQWLRLGWNQVQEHRDGISLDTSGNPALRRAFLKMLPNSLLNDPAQSSNSFRQATKDVHVATAAAFGLLLVRNKLDNAERMQGGRLWQRLHLWVTTQSISVQPLNQTTERIDREQQLGIESVFGNALAELINDDAWQLLMPFRIGYPTVQANRSPRRALEEVLIG
jgi:hypothetical protein